MYSTKTGRIITVISLLAIVLQLVSIRGFSPGQFALFVVPVLFALLISALPPKTALPVIAKSFLSLIAFGLVIARERWLFPRLGGLDPNLPPESDRALTWYVVLYVIYGMAILPFWMFADSLRRHREGLSAELSAFTCYAGIAVFACIAPAVVTVVIVFLHLFPVF